MTYSMQVSRLAVALGVAVTMSACSDTVDVLLPDTVDPLFNSYVALGNSITAGYQSSGINDSTQRESYAFLLAQQMRTRYAYASLREPGCPPPISEFPSTRPGGATSTTCAARDAAAVTYALNNVAVPGATSLDPISSSTSASNPLTLFILGGKSQAARALEANPTFASVWIGNNDVLAAAVSGLLTPTAGVSPGVTPLAQFQANYDSLITVLKTSPTLRGGILIGVVQVAAAPILFPAAALYIPAFKQALDMAAGGTILVGASCLGSTSLISFQIISQMQATTNPHPRAIECQPTLFPPLGNIFVLDPAEQTTLAAAINAYNAHIQSVANANGWAYFDPNPALQALKASGCIATIPNLASSTQTFGECVSLDGVHPTLRAHREVTNALINAINGKYSTSIPLLP